MISASVGERWIRKFEAVIVGALRFLLILSVAIATVLLYVLLVRNVGSRLGQIEHADDLHTALQRGFGGILIVLLGLELMETLRVYFSEHRVRVEVILIVAIIALGRHIIQFDFNHAEGSVLLGLGGLMVALTLGYFLVKKVQIEPPPGPGPASDQERAARTQ